MARAWVGNVVFEDAEGLGREGAVLTHPCHGCVRRVLLLAVRDIWNQSDLCNPSPDPLTMDSYYSVGMSCIYRLVPDGIQDELIFEPILPGRAYHMCNNPTGAHVFTPNSIWRWRELSPARYTQCPVCTLPMSQGSFVNKELPSTDPRGVEGYDYQRSLDCARQGVSEEDAELRTQAIMALLKLIFVKTTEEMKEFVETIIMVYTVTSKTMNARIYSEKQRCPVDYEVYSDLIKNCIRGRHGHYVTLFKQLTQHVMFMSTRELREIV